MKVVLCKIDDVYHEMHGQGRFNERKDIFIRILRWGLFTYDIPIFMRLIPVNREYVHPCIE